MSNRSRGLATCLATCLAALSLAILGVVAVGHTAASTAFAAEPAPETDDQKTFYAIGLAIAQTLAAYDLDAEQLDFVKAGLTDGTLDREPKVPLDEYRPKIQQLARERMQAAAEIEKKASADFLDKKAAEAGAVRAESGLIFIERQAGTGASPSATDTVKVHYHGTLRDGSVFDSSVDRGAPTTFPLNRVIPCWTEGVQKMKVGGKAQLVCPASIAYGDRGSPPKIKPGAALVFDVELIDIVGAGDKAAMPPGHPAVPPPGH